VQMALRDGMKVGDLGAGSGHYAIAAAAAVGHTGRVYAIDVQEDVLKHLADSAARSGKKNIDTIWGNLEKRGGTKLRDGALDAAILANTLFQIEDKMAALQEIGRILRPGGKLLVVDWAGAYDGLGPAAEHVVSESAAEDLFISHGFHKEKSYRGGPHHYAILFTKHEA
jgi:ubiquinone/menaquinone biosynthesis C-methylase UbiE